MSKISFFRELFNQKVPLLEPTLEEAAFLAFMSCIPGQSWFSLKDCLGANYSHFFVAGVNLPKGPVTFNMPLHLTSLAERTGASCLPLTPSGSGSMDRDTTISKLAEFATR